MNPEIYEKIEAYLAKRLSDSERKKFEAEISSDASLKETVVNMQLLRKITERNLTRSKIMSIHNAKTSEWMKSLEAGEEEEFVEKVTLLTPKNSDIVEETIIPDEEVIQQQTELIEEETSIEESAAETELVEEEQETYEYEEEPLRKQGKALSVVLSLLGLLLIVGAAFLYLAKTPLTVREGNPLLTAQGVALDSTQQVYVEIYEEGVQALSEENNLAAITYFDNVISFDRLPGYYGDASRFLNSAAYAQQQQPNKASELLRGIISQKSYAYPYTNKDKIQIWCKIYWSKIMGFND